MTHLDDALGTGSGAESGPLATTARHAQAQRIATGPTLDVLVIGGGITGVGVALDAAARGLRVAIVERDDWACGTSSRSSKMIHGGLRYLATGDVQVVRESLVERRRIQHNAPHLVRPLPMLLPSYGRGPLPFQRMKLGGGLWLYDALGHRSASGARHRWAGRRELSRLVPGVALDVPLRGKMLRGAHAYHDASADDVRLVMAVLRTAVAHGAIALNGTPVLRLLREGDHVRGAVLGGDAVAAASGARDGELEVQARVVVNATGVWADRTLTGVGESAAEHAGFRVVPSKGIHLTVPRERLGIESGIAFFGQTDNSNVFMEPWQDDLAFIGTTDTPYDGALDTPEATRDDIDWLLERVNAFLRAPIGHDDVIAAWAGLRPLVVADKEAGAASKDVSRRHLLVDRPGIVTITGGKLTAYRSMAQVAVDAVARQLGSTARSSTQDLLLDGARPAASASELEQLARELQIDRADARHLLRRHGANVPALVELVRARPELHERLHPERPYLAVEAVWAATQEQARDVEDILARRTRITLETRDPERAAAGAAVLLDGVAPIM